MENMAMPENPPERIEVRPATAGKKRTRTGCLNCRRKRRKCDEAKPVCEACQTRHEACKWGVKLSFRPENAYTMGRDHPSMRQAPSLRSQAFQIVDVTSEVIRDYVDDKPNSEHAESSRGDGPTRLDTQLLPQTDNLAVGDPVSPAYTLTFAANPSISDGLSQIDPTRMSADLFSPPQPSESVFEDGIFLPGSQYQELHAALRSRIIDTARSTGPSRLGSPELDPSTVESVERDTPPHAAAFDDDESRRLVHLSQEQEYTLWQNYINEVASWLDKFDISRHFELVLPVMAKSHPHLKYALLALSARQMERKEQAPDNSCSLALYQHAIHLLSPLLERRTTAVLASCIVLCVLEMLSCSPKAWRRHLDGCAALIQALGISGSCGGLEQALFWCFARMDVCGGLISSETTLIPMHKWVGGRDLAADVAIFDVAGSFDMYANYTVYLCGQVVDLLCRAGRWEQPHPGDQRRRRAAAAADAVPTSALDYPARWSQLFELVERWYQNRTERMRPILTIPSHGQDPAKPFPTVLFGNGPATSGNQMYHTAALLMLKHKPVHVPGGRGRKRNTILWHARQICAISISNSHHGCWTNSTQPLWIAGQLMSHASEHRAILQIYERIERETGWATKWRADDLREYWGDPSE